VLIDNAQKTRLLHDQVTHDGLTGFLNRRTMDETVAIELQRAARYHRDLSVIMLDLDEFKEVNDRLGHQEGDRLLRVFADCIRRLTRSSDAAFRYGGDEFLLMLPETSREGAEQFLARLNDVECPELETVLGHLTFSAGIATHFNDRQATDLIKRADDRLYQSKRLGSGRVTSH
jgi:diguanylate cyclase